MGRATPPGTGCRRDHWQCSGGSRFVHSGCGSSIFIIVRYYFTRCMLNVIKTQVTLNLHWQLAVCEHTVNGGSSIDCCCIGVSIISFKKQRISAHASCWFLACVYFARILLDTNFINMAIQMKLDIFKASMECLLAKCIPCITDCVMGELEKLGARSAMSSHRRHPDHVGI